MGKQITAKVKVTNNTVQGDYASLSFNADYADDHNKAWAYATPSLSLSMTVLPEVADHFPMGQAFTLTFTADGDDDTAAETAEDESDDAEADEDTGDASTAL